MTTIAARVNLSNLIEAVVQAEIAGMPVQKDANDGFTPPSGSPWARLTWIDGSQNLAAVGGASGNLWRGPVVIFIDLFFPQGQGDAGAVILANALRMALRRYKADGLSFQRFDPGFEQLSNGWFQKQVAVTFTYGERG